MSRDQGTTMNNNEHHQYNIILLYARSHRYHFLKTILFFVCLIARRIKAKHTPKPTRLYAIYILYEFV